MDYDERVLPSIGNEVLKAIVAQFDAAELITQREVVSLSCSVNAGWGFIQSSRYRQEYVQICFSGQASSTSSWRMCQSHT